MIKNLDIVTSAKNEAENLPILFERISRALEGLNISWRLIICENASSDGTWEVIQSLARKDSRVLGLRMSRDFGFEGAIAGGLEATTAEAVVMMASDLQDSPEQLPRLIDQFNQGYDHVYQIVSSRPGSSKLRNFNAKIFYSLAVRMSKGLIQPNSSIYRIMSRSLVDQLNSMKERNRFFRALVMYLGYRSIGIEFPREPRKKGDSKASSRSVIGMAMRGILSNSYALLDFVGALGISISALAFLSTVIFSLIWIFSGVPFAGFGLIIGLILLGFGLVFLCLGIMAQYLSLIYEEVKARPNFVVMQRTDDKF